MNNQNPIRTSNNFISKRGSGNYNVDLSGSNIVSRTELSSNGIKSSQIENIIDNKTYINQNIKDHNGKQVINLPQAQKRKNTSQPYTPASQRFISPDQSVRQIDSQVTKNYESERELFNEQS